MRPRAALRRAPSRARPDRLQVLAVVLVLLVAGGLVVGCGGDADDRAPRPATTRGPYLTLTEVESVLERGPLGLVRTGAGEPSSLDDVPAPLVESARYASQSGRQFDVFVFASEHDARRALPAVVRHDEDATSAIRAANVVAVFPKRFSQVDTYRVAASAMRRLRVACTPGGGGDDRLRRLCFSSDDGVPPAGPGAELDEAEANERPVVIDGLRYDVTIARRLNPHVEPDSAMLSGRRPSEGRQWFGVFLRVCNDTDATRTSSARLALVAAFGDHVRASDALSDDNPFVYEPRAIEPETCVPHPGSVAARLSDGLLVPFEVRSDFLEDRPVALEVTGDTGKRERVIIDV